ncbi:TRPM8 channel-associated factor homolog [Hippocampus comes]|uniref:TRPM8 channel-associated factor homolog n=1 Tax=Hippocampus comes TaxID=109280 RepID=UPI00094EDA09|nr:PREDICTED: TRPM8 channel-associated factor homolog [Hippocampus comes]
MATQKSQNEGAFLSLMSGVRELDLRGPCVPSALLLTGEHAFPLVMNSQGQVLMAASQYGSGRIVVLGHEGYLTTFPALVENAVTWLKGDGSRNLSVGVNKSVKAVADSLNRSRIQTEVVQAFQRNLNLGVYVTDALSLNTDGKDLVAFLKNGGGVLIGGQAWSWAADHPKENTLLGFGGNKVSAVTGIYFSQHPGEAELLPVYPQIPASWLRVVLDKEFEDDLIFLLQGISEFDITGGAIASEILVHGRLAFPIGMTEDRRPFLAGTYYGLGRVIVVSHEAYLGREELAPFWTNALHWLDAGRRGTVGVLQHKALDNLKKSGLRCEKSDFRNDLSVFVCSAYSDKHAEEIHNFVAEGGGLLIGGHAWYWAQSHKGGNPLTEFAGNKILNKMGLSLLPETIGGGRFKAPVPSQTGKDSYHFCHLLQRFAAHVTEGEDLTKNEEQCLKKFGKDCASFLKMQAHDRCSYAQVLSTLTHVLKKSGMPQVCDTCPVKSPKDHLLLNMGSEVFKVCPNPDSLLPYLINENPLLPVVYNHRVTLNVNTADREEWVSTGLYLSQGMKTYMAMPGEIVNKGWMVQIGCQTDYLKAEELKRAPNVHEQFPIDSEMMQVWNLWGGLIYLVAPPKTQVGGVQVIVQVAVPAPYYKSGEDDVIGFCVGCSPGHNQQRDPWEFRPHTTECTCNIWSVYIHEEVLGINRGKAHGDVASAKRKSRLEEFVKGGRQLSKWEVWVALETYLQLQERFGWDAFKKVFAAYHKISNYPKDNGGKMNLYAETFSKTVGMNLCGFFKAWSWPIEKATEEKLANLPTWVDHPMVQFG